MLNIDRFIQILQLLEAVLGEICSRVTCHSGHEDASLAQYALYLQRSHLAKRVILDDENHRYAIVFNFPRAWTPMWWDAFLVAALLDDF